jgi:hypothetical protein
MMGCVKKDEEAKEGNKNGTWGLFFSLSLSLVMNNSLSLSLYLSLSLCVPLSVFQNNQCLSHAIIQSYTHKSSAVSPLLPYL